MATTHHKRDIEKVAPDAFANEHVAFAGRLSSTTRKEAESLVRQGGGRVAKTVSGRTTILVVGAHGWALRPDGGVSVKLEQAEKLKARGGRIRIVSELVFAEMAGRGPDAFAPKAFGIDHVAQVVGVDRATIERWERLGLIASEASRGYDFQDIVSLQTIARLVSDGVRPERIRRSLLRLAEVSPGVERPLAQLKVVSSDTGDLLAQVGESLVSPDGQQFFDFKPVQPSEPKVSHTDSCSEVEPPRPTLVESVVGEEPRSASDLFELAVELEEDEQYARAASLYRRVIAMEPGWAEAYFNLGNVIRMVGRSEGAEELYRLALAHDPDHPLSWYNLADVLEESGRQEEAAASLARAIDADPAFADAHFNRAVCLEELGRPRDAQAHWRAYLRLDPHSEWASIARRSLKR